MDIVPTTDTRRTDLEPRVCPGRFGMGCDTTFFALRKSTVTLCPDCRPKKEPKKKGDRLTSRKWDVPTAPKVLAAIEFFKNLPHADEPTGQEYKQIAQELRQAVSTVEKVWLKWVCRIQWREFKAKLEGT